MPCSFARARKKSYGKRSQQSRAIAAGAVGVHTPAMGKALQRGQCMLNDVVTGGTAEARDKTGSAGVMIGVAPVGMAFAAMLQLPRGDTDTAACPGSFGAWKPCPMYRL